MKTFDPVSAFRIVKSNTLKTTLKNVALEMPSFHLKKRKRFKTKLIKAKRFSDSLSYTRQRANATLQRPITGSVSRRRFINGIKFLLFLNRQTTYQRSTPTFNGR